MRNNSLIFNAPVRPVENQANQEVQRNSAQSMRHSGNARTPDIRHDIHEVWAILLEGFKFKWFVGLETTS